jgi:hypothetical protein
MKLRKQTLVDVMLERTIRQHTTLTTNTDSKVQCKNNSETTTSSFSAPENIILEANGTPESIYLWALQSFPNDKEQQHSFQILAATFVLCYCSEADEVDDTKNTLSGMAASLH